MAWQNCENCNSEMHIPSTAEIIIDIAVCPSCGYLHETGYSPLERIQTINELIARLEKGGKS